MTYINDMFIERSNIQERVISELHKLPSLFCTSSSLSECILLYYSNAQGFALIAFILNVLRMYKPSSVVTLLKATYICP